jgi:hypothetical protein
LPANYVFADPKFPFDAPKNINLYNLSDDVNNVDFITVKIGDVNNSATFNLNSQETEKRSEPVVLKYTNKAFKKGEIISLPIYLENDMNVSGAQLDLHYDNSTLEILDVNSDITNIDDSHFYINDASIRLSIVSNSSINSTDAKSLITIKCITKKDGNLSALRLNDEFNNEIYDELLQSRKLVINSKNENITNTGTEVNNYPNPFSNETVINILSGSSNDATLSITDVSGKVISTQKVQLNAGWNKLRITKNDLNGKSGLYIYQIDNLGTIYTGKMILTE